MQRSDDLAALLTTLQLLREAEPQTLQAISNALAAKPGSPLAKLVTDATGGRADKLMAQLIADSQLTAPDYDFPDFTAGGLRWATQGDGRMDTLPLNIDPWMIYYNKELFAAKGLAFPKSFDEIVMAAENANTR